MVWKINELGLENNLGRRVRIKRAPYQDFVGNLDYDEKGFFINSAVPSAGSFKGVISKFYISNGSNINIVRDGNGRTRVAGYVVSYKNC